MFHWLKSLDPVVALLTAIVALVASGASAIYQFWPGLKPDPKVQESGTLAIKAVERNVSRAKIATEGGAKPCPTAGGLSGAQIDGSSGGAVVYADLHVHGLKGDKVNVRCGVLNAAQNVAITSPALGRAVELAKQLTTNDEVIVPLFVRLPAYAGAMKIRVAAFDQHQKMLAFADSPPFPAGVLSSPEVRRATRSEEIAIGRVLLRKARAGKFYLGTVGVLRRGSGLNRGRWAVANVTPFPAYQAQHRAHVALLHYRSSTKRWAEIPLRMKPDARPAAVRRKVPRKECTVPVEILIALNLSAPPCG